jgi:hypothetical protein
LRHHLPKALAIIHSGHITNPTFLTHLSLMHLSVIHVAIFAHLLILSAAAALVKPAGRVLRELDVSASTLKQAHLPSPTCTRPIEDYPIAD